MARILIYNPNHPIVPNQVSRYIKSGHTPDFEAEVNKIIDPDLSAVEGVNRQFWVVVDNEVVEMSDSDKNKIRNSNRKNRQKARSQVLRQQGVIEFANSQGVLPALGSFTVFMSKTAVRSQTVFYIRVYIPEGVYDRMETVIYSGGKSGRSVDLGIYEDSGGINPKPTGSVLVSTGALDTNGFSSKFLRGDLSTQFVVEEPNYYWMAISSNSSSLRISSTTVYSAAWSDRGLYVFKNNHGTTLGELPESFSRGNSAIPYIGLVEED